jgi:hypothetical protein
VRLISAEAGDDSTVEGHSVGCCESATSAKVHRMPRRVTDGVRAEAMGRRLWCLAADSLDRACLLDGVREVLAAHRRTVALLSTDGRTRSYDSVLAACADHGLPPADTVVVYTNLAADSVAFPPSGARTLCINPVQRPPRGGLVVAGVAELDGVLRGSIAHVSASTYHEV